MITAPFGLGTPVLEVGRVEGEGERVEAGAHGAEEEEDEEVALPRAPGADDVGQFGDNLVLLGAATSPPRAVHSVLCHHALRLAIQFVSATS